MDSCSQALWMLLFWQITEFNVRRYYCDGNFSLHSDTSNNIHKRRRGCACMRRRNNVVETTTTTSTTTHSNEIQRRSNGLLWLSNEIAMNDVIVWFPSLVSSLLLQIYRGKRNTRARIIIRCWMHWSSSQFNRISSAIRYALDFKMLFFVCISMYVEWIIDCFINLAEYGTLLYGKFSHAHNTEHGGHHGHSHGGIAH